MRLSVLSDLHVEMAPFDPPELHADVVVLAGDIDKGVRGVELAVRAFPEHPVVYVAGNHEYYGGAIPRTTEKMRAAAAGTNVHVLEQDVAVIEGVRFLGLTLWTDFSVFGDSETQRYMQIAGARMNDFRKIRKSPRFNRFSPADQVGLHRRGRAWLRGQLDLPFDGRTVVVSHHAPSMRSCGERFLDDSVTPAYATNLEAMMGADRVASWIHGHTHHCVDYRVAGTRVVSNQRGYPDEPVDAFDPCFTVELDEPAPTSEV